MLLDQLIEKGLVFEAVDYEASLADILETVVAIWHIHNLLLTNFEHVDDQHDQAMIFIIHQDDPVEDFGAYMDRYVGAEAQRVHRVVIHVFPDVKAGTAPSLFLQLLV